MSFRIVERCVNCWACQSECPNDAIYEASPHFRIDALKCTECEGEYLEPQCSSICPVEAAIVDGQGTVIHPLGSLTGIFPEHWTKVEPSSSAHRLTVG